MEKMLCEALLTLELMKVSHKNGQRCAGDLDRRDLGIAHQAVVNTFAELQKRLGYHHAPKRDALDQYIEAAWKQACEIERIYADS